jgi:hypothetical protein
MASIAHKTLTRSRGSVRAVSANAKHGFSKRVRDEITLIANYGVDGDAHAGSFVKHRYLARWRPRMPNERQVHLIDDSLFDALRCEGFEVNPGGLGRNIYDAWPRPPSTSVRYNTETWERRRHRTERAAHPLHPYERFQKGLLKTLVRRKETPPYRAGVMAIVQKGGLVRAGDTLTATLPPRPWRELPALLK